MAQINITIWTHTTDPSLAHELADACCGQIRRTSGMPAAIAAASVTPLEPQEVADARNAFADAAAMEALDAKLAEPITAQTADGSPVTLTPMTNGPARVEGADIEALEQNADPYPRSMGGGDGALEAGAQDVAAGTVEGATATASSAPEDAPAATPAEIPDIQTLIALFEGLPEDVRAEINEYESQADAEAAIAAAYAPFHTEG